MAPTENGFHMKLHDPDSTFHPSDGAHAAPPATSRDPRQALLELMVTMSLRLRLRGVDLESATGLSGRELDLVAMLTDDGPTSVKSLVADLQLPRSTMTAIVDRLEDRGLVLRHSNPHDRRSVVLEATPKAAEALLRYRNGVEGFVAHVTKVLNESELAAFTRALEKIQRTL